MWLCFSFQTKAGNEKGASDLLVCDANHLSPGSVLEASFSNDSCLSSCLDDILGKSNIYIFPSQIINMHVESLLVLDYRCRTEESEALLVLGRPF